MPPPGLRRLLDEAFAGEFTDDDFDHALGGVHAAAYEDEALVGHASVVPRAFVLDGRPLRCGYVEAVAVGERHRRRGVASALMDALEPVIRREHDFGALSSTEQAMPFYEGRGWRRWQGRLLPVDDVVYVLGVEPCGELEADRRAGDIW